MKYEVFWKNPGYKKRAALKKDVECDYLIVGGGVLGVSLAYFLAKHKAGKIILIEKNTIASGATGKAAGMIMVHGELYLREVIQHVGTKRGLIFWKTSHEGLALMKEIIKKERIECDAEPDQDNIYGGLKSDSGKIVLEEYALEDEIEPGTKLLSNIFSSEEMHRSIKTELFRYAVQYPKHGLSINPLKYTQNLSRVIEKKNVSVYEGTPLIKIKGDIATTPSGTIQCKQVILAIDAQIKDSRIKNNKTTIAITERLTNKELSSIGLSTKKFVWTSHKNYRYLKITKDNRLLLGYGGFIVNKSHKGIDPHPPHLREINNFIKEIFPQINKKIEYAWSASYGGTQNNIPVIKTENNSISVGGASSQLVCTITAKYLADKLTGRSSALDRFFWV